jgi:hypothetical protein
MVDQNTAGSGSYSQTAMSMLDADSLRPNVASRLYNSFGSMWKTYIMLNSLGFNNSADQEDYSHFEKDKFDVPAIIAATGGTSAGTGAGVTVEPTIAGAVGDPIYVRKKDMLMIPATDQSAPSDVRVIVVSVDKTNRKMVLKPEVSTDTIPAIADDSLLVIYSGVSGEASNSVDPAYSRTRKFTNNLQIIDEKVSTTGSHLTDALWFEIGGAKSGTGQYSEALAEGEYRILKKIDGMFYWGQGGGDQIDAESAEGGKQRTSKGVFAEVKARGNEINSFAGDLTSFDAIGENVIANFGDLENPIWMNIGYDLSVTIEDALSGSTGLGVTGSTDQTYLEKTTNAKLYGGAKNSYGSYVNYTYAKRHGLTFMFDVNMNWSNKSTYGNFSSLANGGLAIPVGSVRDQISSTTIPTMGMRYKALGAYNRKFMTDTLIGFGSNKKGEQIVSEVDTKSNLWKAHVGVELMEVPNMSVLTAAAA